MEELDINRLAAISLAMNDDSRRQDSLPGDLAAISLAMNDASNTSKPSRYTVPIDPSGSTVPIDPSGSTVPIDPSGSTVPIDPSGSTVPQEPPKPPEPPSSSKTFIEELYNNVNENVNMDKIAFLRDLKDILKTESINFELDDDVIEYDTNKYIIHKYNSNGEAEELDDVDVGNAILTYFTYSKIEMKQIKFNGSVKYSFDNDTPIYFDVKNDDKVTLYSLMFKNSPAHNAHNTSQAKISQDIQKQNTPIVVNPAPIVNKGSETTASADALATAMVALDENNNI